MLGVIMTFFLCLEMKYDLRAVFECQIDKNKMW